MIKVEHIDVWGFEHAIRGMRNSYASWDKSDSDYCRELNCPECKLLNDDVCSVPENSYYHIGNNDMALMQKLYKAGSSHRKFMRQIFVSMDITAPLLWWKQMDTYKVGVTMNSTSTMHSITNKEFTLDDFSVDCGIMSNDLWLREFVNKLNKLRREYITTNKKAIWNSIIRFLPESYNQRRTVTFNYEVAANIIEQRCGHKLAEWDDFIDILVEELPYLKEITE